MNPRLVLLPAFLAAFLAAVALAGAGPSVAAAPTTQCSPAANYPAAPTPVAFWSTEARCAIVPAGPGGIFGSENFGNKFPGEAAVYMGIVHVAIYDAAVAIDGGYKPYAPTRTAPRDTSPEAAIATAAYDTLTGLQPQLGATQQVLDNDYAAYIAAIRDGNGEGRRDRDRRPGRSGRPRPARERRAWVQHHARRSRPAAGGARASGNRRPRRCSGFAYPGCGRSRFRARRSSGPTAPKP